MEGYSATIKESSFELSAKQRVAFKDTTNAIKIEELIKNDNHFVTDVAGYAVLGIHNEQSENKDYEVYVIVAKDGTRYVTGSSAFFTAFIDIWKELKDETEEWAIEIYGKESKNYKGKQFITCSVV